MSRAGYPNAAGYGGAASLLSALACLLMTRWFPAAAYSDVALGWGLSASLGALGYPLTGRAIGGPTTRFMILGLGGQLARLALLFAALAASVWIGKNSPSAFVSAAMIG